MKTICALALVLGALTAQAQNKAAPKAQPQKPAGVQVYNIPDPNNGDGAMIIEFANAIEGTDGTPQGIGQKASNPGAQQKANTAPQGKANRSGASVRGPGRPAQKIEPVNIGF